MSGSKIVNVFAGMFVTAIFIALFYYLFQFELEKAVFYALLAMISASLVDIEYELRS